jgi:hypothetical protein
MDNQPQKEKRNWWKLLSGWSPLIISIISLTVAGYSAVVATGVRRDNRAIAALDLRPQLKLRTFLGAHKKIPRHFTIDNIGPLEAVQIEVQLLSHFYDRKKDRMISGWGSENLYRIGSLTPPHVVQIPFNDHFLDVNARLHKPLQDNVIEIRISYRHPTDMQLFRESAFCFVNPEGQWVAENISSVSNEAYGKLKEALFARFGNIDPGSINGPDQLHPIPE